MYSRNNLDELLKKASYKSADLKNSKVVIRACLNVPLSKDLKIEDGTRIDEAMPLIEELSKTSKRLVIMAHLGRPEGVDPSMSLRPVKEDLEKRLGEEVTLLDSPDADIESMAVDHEKGKRVFLLENIRYFPGENSKDIDEQKTFAQKLSKLGDLFINDAFPDYRESPSTYYIVEYLPSYIGPAFSKDTIALSKFSDPARPFVAILGGAKLSEKIDVMYSLLERADKVLVGGAMSYTLMKSVGLNVGKSLIEADKLEVAKNIMDKYSDKLLLPVDHVLVKEFVEPQNASEYTIINDKNIPDDMMAVDIGPKTIELYVDEISKAKSILWNGPMGVFEWDLAGKETKEVAETIVKNKGAFKLVGGGDSIAAINKYGVKGFDHISTGGGAMLAFLAYDTFMTLDVILDKVAK